MDVARCMQEEAICGNWFRVRTARLGWIGLLCSGLLLQGCENAVSSPEAEVAGDYEAVEWRITTNTAEWDILAAGGRLTILMKIDGTTAGEFSYPPGATPEPGGREVSMEGTWELASSQIVRFDMPGDTYVRFVDWRVVGDELFAEFMNGGFTVTTRLRK